MIDGHELDQTILEIERGYWRLPGAKEHAARERTGLGPVMYYARLNELLDAAPVDLAVRFGPTIRRLRRLREQRSAQRRAS